MQTQPQILEIIKSLSKFNDLEKQIQENPNLAELIIESVLSNKEVYNRLIKEDEQIRWLFDTFPQYMELILKHIDENREDETARENEDLNIAMEKPKFIHIPVGNYYYVSEKDADNFDGFFTDRVCECVFGIIISDRGQAAFHYYYFCDANILARKISEDFPESTNPRIYLYGGNLTEGFLPWKNKRDISIYNANNEELKGKEAFDLMKTQILENIRQCWPLLPPSEDRPKHRELLHRYLEEAANGTLTYDCKGFNDSLKGKFFATVDPHYHSEARQQSRVRFPITGIKDNIGYQNLADLVQALMPIFPEKEGKLRIQHAYTRINDYLIANFQGKLIQTFGKETSLEMIKENRDLVTIRSLRIPRKKDIEPHTSLNKLGVLPHLKIK